MVMSWCSFVNMCVCGGAVVFLCWCRWLFVVVFLCCCGFVFVVELFCDDIVVFL